MNENESGPKKGIDTVRLSNKSYCGALPVTILTTPDHLSIST